MFRRSIEPVAPRVTLTVDGRSIEAREGDTVAAALLAAGIIAFRTTPVSEKPRGPLCLMGTCFECLVTINGAGSRQACLTLVANGMAVETQHGRRMLT